MPLIDISTLRQHVPLGTEEEYQYDLLQIMLKECWDNVTARSWEWEVGRVELHEFKNEQVDNLYTRAPIQTLTMLEQRDLVSGDSFEAIDSDLYIVLEGTHIRLLDGRCFEELVQVTYDGGYAETPSGTEANATATPKDIIKALIVQGQFFLDRFGPEKVITKSQNFEGGSGVFEKADFHPLFLTLSKKYRRYAVRGL